MAQDAHRKVPILMYHSISDSTNRKFKQFAVSPSLFTEHMSYLYQHNYTTLTVSQLVNAWTDSSTLPERPIVLTFDDAFTDFFTDALPVFKKYGFVATLYVVTKFVNGTSSWLRPEGETARPILSWEQLAEISAYGIECGAHSHNHPRLDELARSAAQEEIVQSKALLEQHLTQEVSSFAYPYGSYTAATRQLVQEAGYVSGCAVKHAFSSAKSDPLALERLMVKADMSVDAFASLITRQNTLLATSYAGFQTTAWQIVRRSSASVQRYLNGGLSAQ